MSLQIYFVIAAFGALLIAGGIPCFLIQIGVSILHRDELRDTTGDPWGGRALACSTSSPPPEYTFAFTTVTHAHYALWALKDRGRERPTEACRPLPLPSKDRTNLTER